MATDVWAQLVDPVTGVPPVRSVYQPIVDLDTHETVAYEALARGPQGSPHESPMALFAAAGQHGTEAQLDLECRAAALRGALEARLPHSVPLFVNAEPQWLSQRWPDRLLPLLRSGLDRLHVFVEITERTLVAAPDGLFAAIDQLREAGIGIALDDVGAEPESLALMPLIEPDVIKLDLSLIQERDTPARAEVVNAVLAQAERSGARILAEGIETQEHADRAWAMGASLGQGWMLGRPGPLPGHPAPSRSELLVTRGTTRGRAGSWRSPFDAARAHSPTRIAKKSLLLSTSHYLEGHALRTSVSPVLLSAFEDARHFTPATARRYQRLAEKCSFVAALGAGMTATPLPGVRGADLDWDDPLRGEWVVCVVGPHFSGALVAKDLEDDGPDADRRFEMVVTYDRSLVIEITRHLISRVAATV